jgi:formylglycine-generating enzyme required for sulfatase activity
MTKAKPIACLLLVVLLSLTGCDFFQTGPSPTDKLFVAVEDNDLAGVRRALSEGADVDARSAGRTSLQKAAALGYWRLFDPLIENGAELEAKDDQGLTPLLIAAEQERICTFLVLLDYGADIEAVDSSGRNVFDLVQETGDASLKNLLARLYPENPVARRWLDVQREGVTVFLKRPDRKRRLIYGCEKVTIDDKEATCHLPGGDLSFDLDRVDIRKTKQSQPRLESLETWTNSMGMIFRKIPEGGFVMGSRAEEPGRGAGEEPRDVRIHRNFWLQTTEVTISQWNRVMGEQRRGRCPYAPITKVSFREVEQFIDKLNELEGTNRYRLPTEDEWEYAARAGAETAFFFGHITDVSKANPHLNQIAWYAANAGGHPHVVGVRRPNPWGLYDMHGNVWEWCLRTWREIIIKKLDPTQMEEYEYAAIRGGAFDSPPSKLRAAGRDEKYVDVQERNIGFRLVRDL